MVREASGSGTLGSKFGGDGSLSGDADGDGSLSSGSLDGSGGTSGQLSGDSVGSLSGVSNEFLVFDSSGNIVTSGYTSGDFAPATHFHTASDITSGTFDDARISESSVLQHESAINHDNLLNVGVNSHGQIDSHIGDNSIHFTESSIDHNHILNIGNNSHADIDNHISDGTIHYTKGSIGLSEIGENISSPSDREVVIYNGGNSDFENRLLVEADIPSLSAGKITTGTFNDARIAQSNVFQFVDDTASNLNTLLTSSEIDSRIGSNIGGTDLGDLNNVTETNSAIGEFIRYDGSNWVNTLLSASDIPNLDASKITTGQFADARISQSSVTQHEGAIDHDNLLNVGTNSHSDIDSHISDGTIHFTEGSIRLTGIGEGISTPSDGDVVIYDGVNSEFENRLLVESDIPNLSAGKITSGTFADARISESSVTQHESALTIIASQVSNFNEAVYDDVAGFLSAGAGISISRDDPTNTITVTNTGTSGGDAQFSGAEATLNTSYSLSNNSATFIPWDGEVFDTDNYHDAGTNPTRLTVPNAGKYYIGGTIEFSGWATLADGRFVIQLYKNGAWVREFSDSNVDADGTDGPAESFGTIVDAAQGDYFELQVRQASGSSRDITTRSVFYAARLQGSGPSQLADLNDVTSVNYTSGRVLRANGSEYVSSQLATSDLNNDLNWTSYDSSDFDTDFGNKTTQDLTENVNLYFTDERAQDAVGNILTDTSSISFAYDDVTPQITATVLESGVDHNSLNNYAQNEHRVWENSITQNIHEDNITELSITQHESALTIDASTQLNNQVPYANLPISSTDVSNWNTAYSQRGSQIAGTNLAWNGTQLDATDTNTQLSQEEVEDFAFGRTITNGTQTLINVAYQDASNALDFVVNSDLSQYDNSTSGFFNQSSQIDHNQTTNYVANEHIDWTADQGTTNINEDNITQASITQHESALTITESQITDGSILARVGGNETITGDWEFDNSVDVIGSFESVRVRNSRSGVDNYAFIGLGGSNEGSFSLRDSNSNNLGILSIRPSTGEVTIRRDASGDSTLRKLWHEADFDNPFPNGGDQAVGSSDNVNFNDGTFGGNVSIAGDLTVSGDKFKTYTETVEIGDNLGIINFGETGAGVTEGFAGWEVDRGTNDPYRWGFEESSGYWKIGQYYTDLTYSNLSGTFNLHEEIVGGSSGAKAYIVSDSSSTLRLKGKTGSFTATETITGQDSGATATVDSTSITDELQAVATRQDSPTNNALAFWNSTDMLFETSSNLTWDGTDLSIGGSNAIVVGDNVSDLNNDGEYVPKSGGTFTDTVNFTGGGSSSNATLNEDAGLVSSPIDSLDRRVIQINDYNANQIGYITARGQDGNGGGRITYEGFDDVQIGDGDSIWHDGNVSTGSNIDITGRTISLTGTIPESNLPNLAGTGLSWDGTDLNVTGLTTSEIASGSKTGIDTQLVTGTAGTSGNIIEWDSNGDAVDSGVATSNVLTSIPSSYTQDNVDETITGEWTFNNDTEVVKAVSGSGGNLSDPPTFTIRQTADKVYDIGDIHSAFVFWSDDSSPDDVSAYPGEQAYIKTITTRGNGINDPDAGLIIGTSNVNDPTYGDTARPTTLIEGSSDIRTSGDIYVNSNRSGNTLTGGDYVWNEGDFTSSDISNWDTAYNERGSQIAGNNLTWDGTQLNATDTDTTYTDGAGLDLSGTTFSVDINSATSLGSSVAGTDEVLVSDVSDSNTIKKTTAQDIADLASGGSPAGSNGEIQFNNSGSFGASSNFFWDNSNNRLGIGTSSPSGALHVENGDFYLNGRMYQLVSGGDVRYNTDGQDRAIWIIYEDPFGDSNNPYWQLKYNGTNSGTGDLYFNDVGGGNMGIGTSSPSYKFEVNGDFNASTLYYGGQDTDDRYLTSVSPAGSNYQIQFNDGGDLGATGQLHYDYLNNFFGAGLASGNVHSTVHSGGSFALGETYSPDITEGDNAVPLGETVGFLKINNQNPGVDVFINLPDAGNVMGRVYFISVENTNGANIVLNAGSSSINGSSSVTLNNLIDYRLHKVFPVVAGFTSAGEGWSV